MPLRQQLNSALYSTGTANPSLISQVNGLESQLQQERYSVFQQVWSLLNSTQQNQVTTLYSQMAANRAQRLNAWKSLHQQQSSVTRSVSLGKLARWAAPPGSSFCELSLRPQSVEHYFVSVASFGSCVPAFLDRSCQAQCAAELREIPRP